MSLEMSSIIYFGERGVFGVDGIVFYSENGINQIMAIDEFETLYPNKFDQQNLDYANNELQRLFRKESSNGKSNKNKALKNNGESRCHRYSGDIPLSQAISKVLELAESVRME